MSKKCKTYSVSKIGLEPCDSRMAFYAGWEAVMREALDAAPQPAAVVQEPVEWYQSMAELAAVYGEMCAINETPSKSQTTEQKERLKVLRAECVNIHYKRIALTASLAPQPARQRLADKQIQDIWCSARIDANQHGPFWFARAIEKAHGIT